MYSKSCVRKQILEVNETKPFSFICGKKNFKESFLDWKLLTVDKEKDGNKLYYIAKYIDSKKQTELTCKVIEYIDYDALEWTLYFKNISNYDTEIFEDICPLDIEIKAGSKEEFFLHTIKGSVRGREDFTPKDTHLGRKSYKKLSCVGGRSSDGGDFHPDTDGVFPFFNLSFGTIFGDKGIIFAIGWSGSWCAEFTRDNIDGEVDPHGLKIKAGMPKTHLKLVSGEQIRTPSVLMFFWQGERIKAHNKFRKFIIEHHTPKIENKEMVLPSGIMSWFQCNYGSGVTEKNQLELIRKAAEENLGVDAYWLDAGWYENDGNWAFAAGNWFPKKKAFPNGLAVLGEEAKKHGKGFVLWFEPERVCPGTQIYNEHREWLIFPDKILEEKRRKDNPSPEALFNLGILEARQWLVDYITSFINESGVTIFRQDFNIDPQDYWKLQDAPDRQGITEIRYIEGLYDFWEQLRYKNPNLLIDSCATGGRRIDIESVSRTVALWRSDWYSEPEGNQSHTLGINLYYPFSGNGTNSVDPYIFRSNLSGSIAIDWQLFSEGFDYDAARKRVKEFKLLRPLFQGDFYPLTNHNANMNSDVWCAYQLDRKDLKRGAVVIFRRAHSPYKTALFKLYNINSEYTYHIEDIDTGNKSVKLGNLLIDEGINIEMPEAPSSQILLYTWNE